MKNSVFFLGIGADLRCNDTSERLQLNVSDFKRLKNNIPVKLEHKNNCVVGFTRLIRLYENKILYLFGEITSSILLKILKASTSRYNKLRREKEGKLTDINYKTFLQIIYPELSLTTQTFKRGTEQFLVEVSLVSLGARRNTPVFYFEDVKELLDVSKNNVPDEVVKGILGVSNKRYLPVDSDISAFDIIVDIVYALQSDSQRKRQLQLDYKGVAFDPDFVFAGMSTNNSGGTPAFGSDFISVPADKYINLLAAKNQLKHQLDLMQFQNETKKRKHQRDEDDDEDEDRPVKRRVENSTGSALKEIRQWIAEKKDKKDEHLSKEDLIEVMKTFSTGLKQELLSAMSNKTEPDIVQASKPRVSNVIDRVVEEENITLKI